MSYQLEQRTPSRLNFGLSLSPSFNKEFRLRLGLSDYLWIFLCLAIGAIPRFYLLYATNSVIDADEAIVGLMAKHINEGRPWPVFYYGQAYMGSFEAFCVALAFRFLGQSSFVLKLVPLIFSLLHIALTYLLARRVTGVIGARVAALLTGMAPAGLVLWSTMARGGFIELVLIGTISLMITLDLLRSRELNLWQFFKLGLVLGFGFWVNNQIVFYIAPVGLVLAVHVICSLGILQSLRRVGIGLLGFVLGGAPFWYVNIFERPRFSTFEVLFRKQTETTFLDHLWAFFGEALPIILGARRFWADTDAFPGGTIIVYGCYLLLLFLSLVSFLGISSGSRVVKCRPHALPSQLAVLWLFCMLVPIIFSASQFGWLSKAPRYLLPLYSVLFVFVGMAIDFLWRQERRFLGLSSGVLLGVIIGTNYASNYYGGVAIPGQPFVHQGDRVAKDHHPLYRWLESHNYQHIRTNYWIGYRIAFETDERIRFSQMGSPMVIRIPDYEHDSTDLLEFAPYVLVPSQVSYFEQGFSELGYRYRKTKVGGYTVIDNLILDWPPGKKLPLRVEQILATSRPDWVKNIIDGDLGSRWGSGTPQRPGMSVKVVFDEPEYISGIQIDHSFFVSDEPRALVVVAEDEFGNTCDLLDLRGYRNFKELLGAEFDYGARWRASFRPRRLRSISLEQQGKADPFDWSIAELEIYSLPNEGRSNTRKTEMVFEEILIGYLSPWTKGLTQRN